MRHAGGVVRKIYGKGIATTMCIGNLRSGLQNVDDYIITHNQGFLENSMLYFGVILCFVLGAVLGNWCIERLGLHAIAVAAALLTLALPSCLSIASIRMGRRVSSLLPSRVVGVVSELRRGSR